MTDEEVTPVQINGWTIYAHPMFLDQLEALVTEVEGRRDKDPATYKKKNCTKRLAAILRLITRDIPADPADAMFWQGKTLGASRKHWFRAKFFGQYRLFFRFESSAKVIVLAWVNDESTLRAYGSKTDAYKTFGDLLDAETPPDDFEKLMAEAKAAGERLKDAMGKGAENG